MVSTSILNTIDPYIPSPQKPWNEQRVRHLYQRLGYGASQAEVQAGLAMSPSDLVDQLLDSVVNMPAPSPPPWANWVWADYLNAANQDSDMASDLYFEHKDEMHYIWVNAMVNEGIRARLSHFWLDHFATEEEVYDCNSYMWAYYDLLNQQVLGNFRTFVEAMGKNPAMLVYLNNNINIADEPNENYARELMELFTMGENNGYTQTDVVEVARALTGWSTADPYNHDTTLVFTAADFDSTSKTIFGQTGNWGYDEVHNLIFTLRQNQVADYMCGKFYRYFLYEEIDNTIVTALADTFKNNNFELLPVFKQFFKSEHFFEERFINARIKSPLECFISLIKNSGLSYPDDFVDTDNGLLGTIAYYSQEVGQSIFNPTNVAGWTGHRAWVNESTLTSRWVFTELILYNYIGDSPAAKSKLQQLATALTNPGETDEVLVTNQLVAHFMNTTLSPANAQAALDTFKGEIPENYFQDGTWNLYYNEVPDQVINLLAYLVRLPEWQLC